MSDDVLRARFVQRLRTHFPEASPLVLALVAIDLRDEILQFATQQRSPQPAATGWPLSG